MTTGVHYRRKGQQRKMDADPVKEGRKEKEKAFKESLKERICLINNSCSERILCRRDVDE